MKVMLPIQKQPQIFTAFRAGYETVSKHLYLVLFPIFLDLFLLFGFRITMLEMMQNSIQRIVLPPSASADTMASWEVLKTQAVDFFRYFSLTSFLRAFPVGIPSLFSVAAFERNPLGEFRFIHLSQPGLAFIVILAALLIGVFLAYLLYRLAARAIVSPSGQPEYFLDMRSLVSWLLIPLFSIILIFLVFLPALLVISIIGSIIPFFVTIGYFFLTVVVITLTIPIIFTPHFIVLEKMTFPQALLTSFRTVRLTNAKTTTFLFLAILANYLTNMLWRIPSDDSWMLMVSIFGHAVISIVTLAASFHYIYDARKIVREFTENQMSETYLA